MNFRKFFAARVRIARPSDALDKSVLLIVYGRLGYRPAQFKLRAHFL